MEMRLVLVLEAVLQEWLVVVLFVVVWLGLRLCTTVGALQTLHQPAASVAVASGQLDVAEPQRTGKEPLQDLVGESSHELV